MNFKNLASKIIDDVSGIKSTDTSKNIEENDILEGLDLDFSENEYKDLSEDFDLDIDDETEEERSQKVEQLFDGYLGEKNFDPNPLEYGPNAMYRKNGTVYRKSVDNLWEAYLKDGSPGARGPAGGSGVGVQEVQRLANDICLNLLTGTNIDSGKISLDRPIRAALFGDSTANTGGDGETDIENLFTRIPLSASYIATNLDTTKSTQVTRLPIRYVANGGISGETLVQFLARTSATVSTTRKSMYDVIDKKPDVVFFHGGSINDLANYIISSATSANFVQATIQRHKQIVDIFTSYGIYVIDPGIYGYNGTNSTSAWIQSQIPIINSSYEALSKNNSMWKFINIEGKLSNNGSYIPGMSTDGIHLNETGAMVLGDLESETLQSIYNVKYAPKNVIYDRIKDYMTTATNPANSTVSYVGVSGISAITTPEKYTATFTITATTNELKFNMANTCFSSVVSGKNYAISPKFKLYKDGVLYDDNINLGYRARIYVSGNAYSTLFTISYSNARGSVNRILLPFSSPFNHVDFGTSTQFYVQPFLNLPLGQYTLEYFPEIIMKFD